MNSWRLKYSISDTDNNKLINQANTKWNIAIRVLSCINMKNTVWHQLQNYSNWHVLNVIQRWFYAFLVSKSWKVSAIAFNRQYQATRPRLGRPPQYSPALLLMASMINRDSTQPQHWCCWASTGVPEIITTETAGKCRNPNTGPTLVEGNVATPQLKVNPMVHNEFNNSSGSIVICHI